MGFLFNEVKLKKLENVRRGNKIYINYIWWKIILIREDIDFYYLEIEAPFKGRTGVNLDKKVDYSIKSE